MSSNQFHIEDRVYHQKYGLGTIIRFGNMKNGDTTADVLFDDFGKKKMALDYANLVAVSPEQEKEITAKLQSERARGFRREDRVRHSKYGFGTVTALSKTTSGDDVVVIKFDTLGGQSLTMNHVDLKRIDLDQEAKLAVEYQKDRMNTFEEPDQENAHVHGSHLFLFYDDFADFIKDTLPLVINRGTTVTCWSDAHAAPYSLPADEPKSVLRAWPILRYGILAVIRIDDDLGQYECVSSYPWTSEGCQIELVINKVLPWSNRLEAQIECFIGDLKLTFFDTLYANHRAFYRSGYLYNFILAGFAYICQVAEAEEIILNDPATIAKWQEIGMRDKSDDSPIRIQTKGMMSLLPAKDGDRDDYQFRGPVKSIKEIELLGKRTWIIRGAFLRSIDQESELDLDIIVPEKSLNGGNIPLPGDDIVGVMWLQGYLWYPN